MSEKLIKCGATLNQINSDPDCNIMIFCLDEIPDEEYRHEVFRLINEAIERFSLSVNDFYFIAGKINSCVRIEWIPRFEIDAISTAKNMTLIDTIRYVAREVSDIFYYSFNLYRQGIVH